MISVLSVGKIKEKALLSCIKEYEKRLLPFTKFQLLEVKDEAISSTRVKEEEQVKWIEGERLLSRIKADDYVIALDLHGETFSSQDLAKHLSDVQIYKGSSIVFVIAGSLGYSEAVIQRANMRWKLSECTFPHGLVRLLVVEQIYRCFMINNHQTYHK